MAVVNAYYGWRRSCSDHGANPKPDRAVAAAHVAWLRKPGADGGNGVGGVLRRAAADGNVTALELAKTLLEHGANPNAESTGRRAVRPDGGTMRNPPVTARTPPPQLHRRDALLPGGPKRRRAVHAAARRARRGSQDPDASGVTPLMMAPGSTTGKAKRPARSRAYRSRAARGREAGARARQRHQRGRGLRRLHDRRANLDYTLLYHLAQQRPTC